MYFRNSVKIKNLVGVIHVIHIRQPIHLLMEMIWDHRNCDADMHKVFLVVVKQGGSVSADSNNKKKKQLV